MKNSILEALDYDGAKGALSYKGIRYMLIRPETIMDLHKSLEERLGTDSRDILYHCGFVGGSLSAEKYREQFGDNDQEMVAFIVKTGCEIGWGSFKLELFDREKQLLKIRLDNSAFAQAYGPSTHSVCHIVAGIFAGMGRVIFQRDMIAEEKSCVAAGDPYCQFVAWPD